MICIQYMYIILLLLANGVKNFSSDIHGPEEGVSVDLQLDGATTVFEWHRTAWRTLGVIRKVRHT